MGTMKLSFLITNRATHLQKSTLGLPRVVFFNGLVFIDMPYHISNRNLKDDYFLFSTLFSL